MTFTRFVKYIYTYYLWDFFCYIRFHCISYVVTSVWIKKAQWCQKVCNIKLQKFGTCWWIISFTVVVTHHCVKQKLSVIKLHRVYSWGGDCSFHEEVIFHSFAFFCMSFYTSLYGCHGSFHLVLQLKTFLIFLNCSSYLVPATW